jgi:hypothetical protein
MMEMLNLPFTLLQQVHGQVDLELLPRVDTLIRELDTTAWTAAVGAAQDAWTEYQTQSRQDTPWSTKQARMDRAVAAVDITRFEEAGHLAALASQLVICPCCRQLSLTKDNYCDHCGQPLRS